MEATKHSEVFGDLKMFTCDNSNFRRVAYLALSPSTKQFLRFCKSESSENQTRYSHAPVGNAAANYSVLPLAPVLAARMATVA